MSNDPAETVVDLSKLMGNPSENSSSTGLLSTSSNENELLIGKETFTNHNVTSNPENEKR